MATDMIARALAIKANKTLPAISSADAGKLATVDSNGKWAAANLTVGQGEVAVDNTLLVSGAAADAKVTGDKITDLKSALTVPYDFVCDKIDVINKPDSTVSTTNPSNIFGIGKIFNSGYYTAKFYTSQTATLYVFAVDNLSDTSPILKAKISAESVNGVVSFENFRIDETCIIALQGSIGYKANPSSPYYLITNSNETYSKPEDPSGNVVFNIEVKKITQKANESVATGIPYIAHSSTTVHIKLIGDSITQGSGSTGYIEFVADGLTYRGNAPNYPEAGADYQVGKYLGSLGVIRWYEALDGSGWGQLLKAYFEDKFNCTVKNYGTGGATTQNIINIWDNLIDADDDIVIIMCGTNDRRSLSLDTFYNNLQTIVSRLLFEGKKVIVMSSPPILPTVDVDSQYFHLEDACNNSSAIAYNNGCTFIDNFGYINEYCELKGVLLSTLLNSDGIHPNDSGYRVLFNNIVEQLRLGRKVNGATW